MIVTLYKLLLANSKNCKQQYKKQSLSALYHATYGILVYLES